MACMIIVGPVSLDQVIHVLVDAAAEVDEDGARGVRVFAGEAHGMSHGVRSFERGDETLAAERSPMYPPLPSGSTP
jgi:hypothetical protein